MYEKTIEPVAIMHTGFGEKFGIPRQSGLVPEAAGRIIFEPKYRNPDALRGIEEFTHLWIIWGFSENRVEKFTPLVTPPRLGGREKRGVFATRSPFRPNGMGLSSVRLDKVEYKSSKGPIIHVSGVDMLDGTPIYDIKPYLAYADSHPKASDGFAAEHRWDTVHVIWRDEALKSCMEQIAQEGAIQIFREVGGGMEEVVVGVVGVLQLEVLEYRLNTEYNVEIRMQQLPFEQLRWVKNDPDTYNLQIGKRRVGKECRSRWSPYH